jgi:succinate-semialdehyde dehydrogenase/glutarate-semialdehyde dehydrogenase
VLGNTVILKHAEITPQCAVAVEQLFLDAGAPEGVFTNTFLHIADVEQVIADPRIQGVTLTGCERAGTRSPQGPRLSTIWWTPFRRVA